MGVLKLCFSLREVSGKPRPWEQRAAGPAGNPPFHSAGAKQLFLSDFGRDPEISVVYFKPPSHLGILGEKACSSFQL